MKYLLILLLVPYFMASQTQIGNNILGDAGENAGVSVAISGNGNFMVVGFPFGDVNSSLAGKVKVYENIAGNWTQVGNAINGEHPNDFSGESVSINHDGTIIAIGADSNNDNGTNSGHVRIFTYDQGNWTQLGSDIDGESIGDLAGFSVDLSDDGLKVALGAILGDENDVHTGYVSIYEYKANDWLKVGNNISGISTGVQAGYSVALNSNAQVLAIGSLFGDGNEIDSGIVRVFEYDGTNWNLKGSILNGESANDFFGHSVSLNNDGSILAVGAPRNNTVGSNSGQVKVYEFIANDWVQMGSDINAETSGDRFGFSVSLNGDGHLVAVGATENDDNGSAAGHTRIHTFDNNDWTQIGNDINGTWTGDNSGRSVSLSDDGTKVAIGAPFNNINGNGAGLVQVYNLGELLSIDEFDSNQVRLFPNPAIDKFTIQMDNDTVLNSISIYNLLGEKVMKSNSNSVNINPLSSGVYIVEIETDLGKLTKKLIIK